MFLFYSSRLCGFEPFFDPRGDQYMYSRILNCDYEFVSPWWDEVSLNAKDLVSSRPISCQALGSILDAGWVAEFILLNINWVLDLIQLKCNIMSLKDIF